MILCGYLAGRENKHHTGLNAVMSNNTPSGVGNQRASEAIYFSLVVYIYIDLTACTLAKEKGVAFRLFPI